MWGFLSATWEQFAGSETVETNPAKEMFLCDVMMCNCAIALGVLPLVKNYWYVPLAVLYGVMMSPAVLLLTLSLCYASAEGGVPEQVVRTEGTRGRSISLAREEANPKVA